MKRSKGLNLGDLQGMAIALVVLVVVIVMGVKILDQIQETEEDEFTGVGDATGSNATMAWNTSQSGLEALDLFGDWFEILVIVVIAVVVIGLLVSYFSKMG